MKPATRATTKRKNTRTTAAGPEKVRKLRDRTRDNFALARFFDWWRQDGGPRIRRANRWLARFGFPVALRGRLDPSRDMTSLEQRINLWLLAEQVVGFGVPGDFAEFGCFDGRTATLFAQVLRDFAPGRRLHLYDRFDVGFHLAGRDISAEVAYNFAFAKCPLPKVHKGDFTSTVPSQLPRAIAFAHIDCGFGGDVQQHRTTVYSLLGHIYPRMPKGAICVLMDYRHPALTDVEECNPGARLAADEFLADKSETLTALHAGEACHAFFRKA